jgi:Spy/CpxP family protein refolding chaperone
MLATGALIAIPAQAQDKPDSDSPRRERPEGGQRGNAVNRMKEALDLSDEQVEKIKPLLAAQQEEIQAVRKAAGENPDREKMRSEVTAIRDKYKVQVEAVLTEEQKAKLEKLQNRMRGPGGPGGEPRGERREKAGKADKADKPAAE